MAEMVGERTVICLVHHWTRLTRTGDRAEYQHKEREAGGYTATTFGEDDQLLRTEHEALA
ncbi:hypothetical protein [Streptomyces scopuliridis]|uniref:hypothetical protein n=1 Tax=Streptomyces scopuliridis TaxID=452529 RepID=UPI0034441BE0